MATSHQLTEHQSTPNRQLSDQQKAELGNCEDTVCIPINWSDILACSHSKWTPRSVRAYLNTLCVRMNRHFALIMSGQKIGSIEVTRQNRAVGHPPIKVVLSTWRCQQLFNRYVELQWREKNAPKRLRMTLLNLWMRNGLRKEIQPATRLTRTDAPSPPSPSIDWLKRMLSLAGTDVCPVTFNALNTRAAVYESFWEVVGSARQPEWTAKRISEALYHLFPQSRPKKGARVRLRGVAVINIPSEEQCREVLARVQTEQDFRLLF
jgi:hypothetical protein